MRLLVFIIFSVFQIPLAYSGTKCNTNIRTVPMDFVLADKKSKEWYTPYSSHFINQSNFCSTSHYQLEFPYLNKGLEVNATLKKKSLKNSSNLDYRLGKKPWIEMYNYFIEDQNIPGVSHWTTQIGPFTIKTDQYVFAVSPNLDWWATYYCAPGNLGLKKPFTEGIDIRSTALPMDPMVLQQIKNMAIRAGVDPNLVNKIKPSAYMGCRVKDNKGKKYIFQKNPILQN